MTLAVAALVAMAAFGCSLGAEPGERRLLGSWRVVSFTDENGQPEPVVVGANTADQPTFTFERRDGEYLAGGDLGCNTVDPGPYALDGDRLTEFGSSVTEMECELEIDGEFDAESAMRSEQRIRTVLAERPLAVEFDDDESTMSMSSAGGELVLVRIGGAPGGDGEPDASAPIGPLSCSGGPPDTELLQGSGLSQAEAARAADPAVVSTDNNLHTTFGFDADGTMIVEVQNSDTAPGDYRILTCSDE